MTNTAKTLRIALYPGDGIGPEVIDQAVRVLDAAQTADGAYRLEFTRFPWGADFHFQHGQAAPDDLLEVLRPFDAILLGALGDPARLPDHVTLAPLIRMRQGFDQYACVRPARLREGIKPLLTFAGRIDMVVVRENSEGEYVGHGGRFKAGTPDEVATETAIHTRRGIEHVLRYAFTLARTRRGHVTMITKSNALKHGMVLWDQVLEQIRPEFPDVEAAKLHVDAAAMDLVRRPGRFDVVVASNLFGDILTDLAGAIVGGLGVAPSANINPERTCASMFEPVHGSAPDIAGKGIANPLAAILSAAMMLDFLGLPAPAARIDAAVDATIRQGQTTPDLGGRLTTAQAADCVIANLAGART